MNAELQNQKLIAIQIENRQITEPNLSKRADGEVESLLLIFMGIGALGAIATFLAKEFNQKTVENKFRARSPKIPCPNCRYFSKSSYLRCAVQPKSTMTDDAIHCIDYEPYHR